MSHSTGGQIYESRLKTFNDGINNTTQAVNQYAAAFRVAQAIARDATKTAAEKAEALRQATIQKISGAGSGIEGFANSYTNGVNHMNEVRHGFVQRNFIAKSGKLVAQQLAGLRSDQSLDPRLVAANKMSIKPSSVQNGLAHAVGEEGGSLSEETHGGAGSSGFLESGSDILDDYAKGASGITDKYASSLRDMGMPEERVQQLIGDLAEPQSGDIESLKSLADMVDTSGGSGARVVAQSARPVAPQPTQVLGEEPEVGLGQEASKITSEVSTATKDVSKGVNTATKVAQGIDEVLPEVDDAAAATAEVPVVGEAVGALGGLLQLGASLDSAFGGKGEDTIAKPGEDEALDGETMSFAPGQVGGNFNVS